MFDEYLIPLGIKPDVDVFASSAASDVLNLSKYQTAKFIVYVGDTSSGSITIKIESCDDTTPTTATPVAYRYRLLSSATNVYGSWTDVTATGYSTVTTTSNFIVECEINSDELSGTDKYVRCRCVEVDNDPIDGCVVPILLNPRYHEDIMDSATV